MPDPIADKASRLVTPASYDGGGRPPAPPRAPIRMAPIVPTHTHEQMQQYIAAEKARQRAAAEEQPGEPAQDAAMAELKQFVRPVEAGKKEDSSPAEDKKADIALSSFDIEVMELSEQLDLGQLILNGYIVYELEIIPDMYSVSAKSLRKADLTAIQRDVDAFRRGRPVDPDNREGEWITPFPHAVGEFAELRQLAEGIVGLNGTPLVSQWEGRMVELEGLDSSLYNAIAREYKKFLTAVAVSFPDKMTKKAVEKLKERLGKVQAHR